MCLSNQINDINAEMSDKVSKYADIGLSQPVDPIVLNQHFYIHPDSLQSLYKHVSNVQSCLADFAISLVRSF